MGHSLSGLTKATFYRNVKAYEEGLIKYHEGYLRRFVQQKNKTLTCLPMGLVGKK